MNANEKGHNENQTQSGFTQNILHAHEWMWREQRNVSIFTENLILMSATRSPYDVASILNLKHIIE